MKTKATILQTKHSSEPALNWITNLADVFEKSIIVNDNV